MPLFNCGEGLLFVNQNLYFWIRRLVRRTNWSTERRSGRSVRRGSMDARVSAAMAAGMAARRGARELRSVLRRMEKACFTTFLKSAGSQPRSVRSLRVSLRTPLRTLGGGVNTNGSTVNRYSQSYQACSSTDRMPRSRLPGAAQMRSATSFCSMPAATGMRSRWSRTRKNIWLEMLYGKLPISAMS